MGLAGAVNVPGTTVATASPALQAPATCTVSACTSSTTTNPISTPPVARTCGPLGICVSAEAVPLLPSMLIPAVCATTAAPACRPASTLLPAGFVAFTVTVMPGKAEEPTRKEVPVDPIIISDNPVHLGVCENSACTIYKLEPDWLFIGASASLTAGSTTIAPPPVVLQA